jgi:hypothetical protein
LPEPFSSEKIKQIISFGMESFEILSPLAVTFIPHSNEWKIPFPLEKKLSHLMENYLSPECTGYKNLE